MKVTVEANILEHGLYNYHHHEMKVTVEANVLEQGLYNYHHSSVTKHEKGISGGYCRRFHHPQQDGVPLSHYYPGPPSHDDRSRLIEQLEL